MFGAKHVYIPASLKTIISKPRSTTSRGCYKSIAKQYFLSLYLDVICAAFIEACVNHENCVCFCGKKLPVANNTCRNM